MSGAAFLRLKKLKGGGVISRAARHNRRVIQAEMGATGSIDPSRSHLNETIAGPPAADDVANIARDRMRAAGVIKPRSNAVLGLEIVFSLPTTYTLDDRAFFTDCLRWAANQFGGGENILSADIHRDEAAPHCHILIMPMIDGRMVGSDMVGGRAKLRDTLQNFHEEVAQRYGLSKAPPRLLGATKTAAASAVLDSLRQAADGALRSLLWAQFRDGIERDPGPYLLALGIDVDRPAKRLRTVEQIFTSKGKGKNREDNPIGFAPRLERPSLCSVGFAAPPAAAPSPAKTRRPSRTLAALENSEAAPVAAAQPATTASAAYERVREAELSAEFYDAETGEFLAHDARQHRSAIPMEPAFSDDSWPEISGLDS